MNSKLDLLVLGLLTEQPLHGYEVYQILTSEEMREWVDIGITSIYNSLSRLKQRGHVIETVDTGSSKQKNVYHITSSGRETFLENVRRSLARQEKLALEDNFALFFINKLNPSEAVTALKIREGFLRTWIDTLNEMPDTSNNKAMIELIYEHTRTMAQTEADWIKSLVDRIEGRATRSAGAKRNGLSLEIHGSLEDKALSDVVHLVAAGKRTGTLQISRGYEQRAIAFKEGEPAYIISPGQDVVESKQLQGNLALKVLSNIYETFAWPEGNYSFDPDVLPTRKTGIPIKISQETLILEGCRRVESQDKIRAVVPSDEVIFDLVSEQTSTLPVIAELGEQELNVLKALNGVRDVHYVAEICHISVFEASKIFYILNALGLVKQVGSDKANALKLFKQVSKMLLERISKVAGAAVLDKIEKQANLFDGPVRFECKNGSIVEHLDPGVGLLELIDRGTQFIAQLIGTVAEHVGKSFTVNLLNAIHADLPAKMASDFEQYGLGDIAGGIKGPSDGQ